MRVEGLKGEVFPLNGKVAGSVPPMGRSDAIPFQIMGVSPETARFPSWADMIVGKDILVRINPDLCLLPFYRLFDCISIVYERRDDIIALETGKMFRATLPPTPHPNSESFLFWPAQVGNHRVIMVDTEERVLRWNPQS